MKTYLKISLLLTLFLLGFLTFQQAATPTALRQARIANQVAHTEAWGQVGLVLIYAVGVSAVSVLLALPWTAWSFARKLARSYRAEGGLYPILVERPGPLARLRGQRDPIVINPNLQATPVARYREIADGVQMISPPVDAEQATVTAAGQRVQMVQAMTYGKLSAGAGRLLAGAYDPHTPAQNKPIALPVSPVQRLLTLDEAVLQSKDGQIVLGQNKTTGALAIWDSDSARQIGIFGANGTGKTASAAATAVASLIRAGYHVIILDPKGGADWRIFESWAERHDSDAEQMGAQLAAVVEEMERRGRLCEAHEVSSVDALPANARPPAWALVIEELGDTRIEAEGLGILDNIDRPLDRLMAMSRYTGLRIVLIDQRPQGWPSRVRANTKEHLTFRQGMGQGQAVGYYHAHHLAQQGEFAMNGERYHAYHALPAARELLATVPALAAPRIVPPVRGFGGSAGPWGGVSGAEDTPTSRTAEPNEPTELVPTAVIEPTETELQQAARAWIAANPDGIQIEMRRALDISSAYGSELWHKCHPQGDNYTPAPQRMWAYAADVQAETAGLDWRGMDKNTLIDLLESTDTDTARQAFLEWNRRGERISFGGE